MKEIEIFVKVLVTKPYHYLHYCSLFENLPRAKRILQPPEKLLVGRDCISDVKPKPKEKIQIFKRLLT